MTAINRPDALLDDLARASRILEMEGHGDMTLGHLSLRDPGGRGLWLKRNSAGLGEIAGPDDFILIDFDGNKLAGEGGRHSEWVIHSEILRLRPDIEVVAHTHPFHACVFSASPDPLLPFTVDADYFAELPRHESTAALINTPELGADLATGLGPTAYAIMMANHGVTFCGTSIPHATMIGVFLEHACRAHVVGLSSGMRCVFPSAEERALRHSQIMQPTHISHSWDFYIRHLSAREASLVHRASLLTQG